MSFKALSSLEDHQDALTLILSLATSSSCRVCLPVAMVERTRNTQNQVPSRRLHHQVRRNCVRAARQKEESGSKTPPQEIEKARVRLRDGEKLYAEWKEQQEQG